jgi:hypothetical protein
MFLGLKVACIDEDVREVDGDVDMLSAKGGEEYYNGDISL